MKKDSALLNANSLLTATDREAKLICKIVSNGSIPIHLHKLDSFALTQ